MHLANHKLYRPYVYHSYFNQSNWPIILAAWFSGRTICVEMWELWVWIFSRLQEAVFLCSLSNQFFFWLKVQVWQRNGRNPSPRLLRHGAGFGSLPSRSRVRIQLLRRQSSFSDLGPPKEQGSFEDSLETIEIVITTILMLESMNEASNSLLP